MTFELLPAIDLRGGRVVRLVRGDFAAETVYGEDPATTAAAFASAGARWLHVVDLDGARHGAARQGDAIRRIVAAVGEGMRCEVAGGLRDPEAVEGAFADGAARVVVGTAALRETGFAGGLVRRFGVDRIAVALDVRDGLALGEAWRSGAPGRFVDDAVRALADAGIATFEVTAIDRDGLLGGPDLALLGRVVGLGIGSVIASGGVTTLDDLRAVRALGCRGAIVGRALYEGRLDLREALAAVAG